MIGRTALRTVGRPDRRIDAVEKVSGAAVYTVDIELPGMLHARVLRSPHGHARIRTIDASAARAMPGVHAVLTRDETASLPMPVYGYFIKDQPIVATDKVRYEGDIVAAVAAEDEATANRALAAIRVDYEPLPAVTDIERASDPDAAELFEQAPVGIVPHYGQGASGELRPRRNVCYRFSYETGPADAFDDCDHVFEDTFRFSRMHHFHLEPFVCVADWSRADRIELWTSCQNPFPLRKEIARIFGLGENRIAVRVPHIGGGFGSKNGCKTEPVALALSRLAGRPVRFCLTLEEGFLTNTQHAAVLTLKTGVMDDGTLIARQSRILLDSGAYSDGSPLVAEKAGYRIPGPYRYRHIKTDCDCVMTNTAPAGPFRGFGGTQTSWACESQIDMIAHRLGIDPYEMRRKNLIDPGEPFVPGESGMDSDLREGLDLVVREIGYRRRRRLKREGPVRRGIGLAIGFKDGGGVNKPALARVRVSTGGDIFLQCGTVEIGQGAHTALCAVVAEVLNAGRDRVRYHAGRYRPFALRPGHQCQLGDFGDGPGGRARRPRRPREGSRLRRRHAGLPAGGAHPRRLGNPPRQRFHPLAPMIMARFGGTGWEFVGEGFHKAQNSPAAPLEAPCVFWEIGWGGAQVAVDTETGKVTVERLFVTGDAGRAIHPAVCRGQDEGAALMGLSQALFERMIYDGSRLVNGDALMYRVPLADDLPADFRSITQEQGLGPGPFGAKGMGEGGMLPVASAVANAIHDAVGVRLTDLPLTAERVLAALDAKARGQL